MKGHGHTAQAGIRWLLDSGATHHMTSAHEFLAHGRQLPCSIMIRVADGEYTKATAKGSVVASVDNVSPHTRINLSDVLLVPKMAPGLNLLSTTRLAADGWVVVTTCPASILVGPGGQVVVAETDARSNSRFVRLTPTENEEGTAHSAGPDPNRAWLQHWRCGHLSARGLKQLVQAEDARDVGKLTVQDIEAYMKSAPVCEVCALANMKEAPYSARTFNKASRRLERVFADIMGPFTGNGTFVYVLTLVDEWSRKTWVFPLPNKTSVSIVTTLQSWAQQVETETGDRLTHIHSDNGLEFAAAGTQTWTKEKGILWTWTAPYSSAQNGVVERHNGLVQEKGRALLIQSRLAEGFWPFAFLHACYILNRSPSTAIGGRLPQAVWSGRPVSLGMLRSFGCLAFAYIHPEQRKRGKLSARAIRGIFLGCSETRKAWLIFCPSSATNSFRWSRTVVFDETRLYDMGGGYDTPQNLSPRMDDEVELEMPPAAADEPTDGEEPAAWEWTEVRQLDPTPVEEEQPEPTTTEQPEEEAGQEGPVAPSPEADPNSLAEVYEDLLNQGQVESEGDGPTADLLEPRPEREKRRSPRLQAKSANPAVAAAWACVSLALLEAAEGAVAAYVARLTKDGVPLEPKTVREAKERSPEEWREWKRAMDAEMESLQSMGTWELVDRPAGRPVVGCKWVLKVKTDQNGRMVKRKARLVAKGYSQVDGIDYEETFAPVARLSSFRLVISLAHSQGWILLCMDVKAAYLNGTLDLEVYMEQPPEFDDGTGRVCRLVKSLYGLKQSGRAWFITLHARLTKNGYTQLQSENCVFVFRDINGLPTAILTLYVDDIVIAAKDRDTGERVKEDLKRWFSMTDNGDLSYVLGIRVQRTSESVSLSQTAYIEKLATDYPPSNGRRITAPVRSDGPPAKLDGELLSVEGIGRYAALVGSLLWVSQGTRPDIAFITSHLSRFMSCARTHHWEAALRVVQYLNATKGLALVYKSASETILEGFSDADHASDLDSRRSVSAYVFRHRGNTITWRSKLQDTVSVSSAEAEYVALSAATREAIYLKQVLEELAIVIPRAIDVYTDSTGASAISEHPSKHSRTKHIQVHHHLVRHWQSLRIINIQWIEGDRNVADFLTKAKSANAIKVANRLLGLAE